MRLPRRTVGAISAMGADHYPLDPLFRHPGARAMKIPVVGVVGIVRADLLQELLEELANTPLMYKNENDETIDQTSRVMWAMQFIRSYAERQGMDVR